MKQLLFIGIDIGGTKISSALVSDTGQILSRTKESTPAGSPGEVFKTICRSIDKLIQETPLDKREIAAIGMGIPGILTRSRDRVLVSPNAAVANFAFPTEVEKKYKIRTVMENDVNVGLLGEKWMGAAKNARIPIGIFPGTGIGGAMIINDELFIGASGAGTEFGHMIVLDNGPKCGCGNRGCLEAIASRRAIERDIRTAIKKGKKTIITKLAGKTPRVIKSGMLKKALRAKDKLVTEILRKAAKHIGVFCVSIRHAFDPDMIVFGGGLIEACGDFLLPNIKKTVEDDPYFKKVPKCRIVKAKLGDDAAVLGAVALAMQAIGMGFTQKRAYPHVTFSNGKILVDGEETSGNILVRADGKIKVVEYGTKKDVFQGNRSISGKTLKKMLKKQPEVLIIGVKGDKTVVLEEGCAEILTRLTAEIKILPIEGALEMYSSLDKKKALVLEA
jgi:glucokinase